MSQKNDLESIAVVGVSCLFPGADTPELFWNNLLAGRDATAPATADQMGVDPAVFYHPQKGQIDKIYCKQGGFVQGFQFDPTGYHICPEILDNLDDLFKWSLYVARQALRDSGYLERPEYLSRCGLALGNLSFPTRCSRRFFGDLYRRALTPALRDLLHDDDFDLPSLSANPGPAHNARISGYPPAVVAQALGLGGRVFALDAACASSLYGVDLACRYLRSHQADLMLAGAVSCADPLFIHQGFSIFQAYPENGRSRPLDRSSGGLIAAEGAGMFVLKRYADAQRDGDRVYAVIRGIGLSNDGKGKSVLHPDAQGQMQAFERAYGAAKIDPDTVDYVECHATGTPVGDPTELDAMAAFWGARKLPRIGSVKSNLGHMLTAAGMASMLKVILSLERGQIPPTLDVTDPQRSAEGRFGPEHIVTAPMPWPNDGRTRRAGVSAFGFGGTNAHLILEQASSEPLVQTQQIPELPVPLAIVGMEATFGGCKDLDAFAQTVYRGSCHTDSLPVQRWKGMEKCRDLMTASGLERAPDGAYIADLDIDFLNVKTPPGEADQLIPQQLLMLQVADRALKDAGMTSGGRVGVIVAMGAELAVHTYLGRCDLSWQIREGLAAAGIALSVEQAIELETIVKDSLHNPAQASQYTSFIGNLMAARIAALWDFSGPAFTLSAAENAVPVALEVAQMLLADGEVEAMVVGAVDLAGGIESVVVQHQLGSANTWSVGEGAGAVVLKRRDGVDLERDHIYAVVDAVSLTRAVPEQSDDLPTAPSSTGVLQACERAFELAGIAPTEVAYLELSGGGSAEDERAEMEGVTQAYAVESALHCKVGSAKTNIGHSGNASGMAALIKTALCLHHGFFPGSPDGDAPDCWKAGLFNFPAAAQPWTVHTDDAVRRAAVNVLGSDGYCGHIILSGIGPVAEQARQEECNSRSRLEQAGSCEQTQEDIVEQKSLVRTVPLGGPSIEAAILAAKGQFSSTEVLQGVQTYEQNYGPVLSQNCEQSPASISSPHYDQTPAPIASPLNGSFQTVAPSGSGLLDQTLAQNRSRLSQSHAAFLALRTESLRTLGAMMQLQSGAFVQSPDDPAHPRDDQPQAAAVIWDEAALHTFAAGNIADVFGAQYAVIDTYARRVRLPKPPYLLVSRVRRLDAERGVFKASSLTTEYDIPPDAWYGVDSQVPWAVAVESGQCDLLLISYLGIDFECKGERIYRLLDCTLTFLDAMPLEGDTLRYDIKINSFSRSGDSLLFFFSYECFVKDRMVLQMDGGCAGFFTDHELAQGKGVIYTESELAEKDAAQKQSFAAPLLCRKTSFARQDLLALTRGDLADCFGASHAVQGSNPSLRLPPEAMLMVDRIVAIDAAGGAWGLGMIVAEKDLAPDHWYFPCHFEDDQVLAGSLMGEACAQVMQFYQLYLGLHTHVQDARFQPIANLPQKVRCRGQVVASDTLLTYRMEVKEIGLHPAPYAKADVEVILEGKTIVHFQDLGLQLLEKSAADPHRIEVPGSTAESAQFGAAQIEEFAIGSVAKCFGPEYEIYDNKRVSRTPNGDLQLLSRIRQVEGERGVFSPEAHLLAEYDVPADPWFYRENSHPGLPYSMAMEIGLQPCGFLSAYLGSTLLYPDIGFYFRNLDGQGHLLSEVDVRGKTLTTRAHLLSSTALEGVIIQKFAYELGCGGETFFSGDAAFGYFTADALANQVGLDGGKEIHPWFVAENREGKTVDLSALQKPQSDRPHFRLASGQLHLLDQALVIADGGRYGRGYVYAGKETDPQDWFFSCHFHQDPVMPGSLGVEAIIQAVQIYALEQDLGRNFTSPCFRLAADHLTVWKYRGQITPADNNMSLEVHIQQIVYAEQHCTVVAAASLWKGSLRIYEVQHAAIRIAEAPASGQAKRELDQ